jgi:hypothetical protein
VVDPAPPRQVRLATGQENSAYEEFGKQVREGPAGATTSRHAPAARSARRKTCERLRAARPTSPSCRAARPAKSRPSERGLVSLGSLFTEPVWLFLRDGRQDHQPDRPARPAHQPGAGRHGRAEAVPPGAGRERRRAAELTIGALENTPATVELLAGRIDGLVFSSAPEAPLIQMLLQTPGIRLFDFRQAEAYTRRLPFLTHVVLPRGIVDLGRDIPSQDYHLIAPTATLVAREDLHPALVDLFVKAATEIHGGAGWFQQQGQFPSPKYTEIPVAREAAKYYRDGPPLLQRYMSLLAGQPVRPAVGRGGGAGGADDSAVEDRAAAVRVAHPFARVPLVRQLRAVEQAAGRAAGRAARDCDGLRSRPAAPPRRDRETLGVNHISIPLAYADGCMACAAISTSCASACQLQQ